jgi:aspartate oxidase
VQFHPTGLVTDVIGFDGSLVEEAVRFDGARLLDGQDRRFMHSYHSDGERSTRDEVARGIFREILAGRGHADDSVTLDLGECASSVSEKYPALAERLRQAGYCIEVCPRVRVRPTAHFLMGGLRIDRLGRTTLPGVFAAGETAGGVHGANRLGGNGLSEALVFGRIAGGAAADEALGRTGDASNCNIEVVGHYAREADEAGECAEALLDELRTAMYWNAGLLRSSASLSRALSTIEHIEARLSRCSFGSGSRAHARLQTWFDLRHLTLASRLIVEAALARNESRGAHHRIDFPQMAAPYAARVVRLREDGERLWRDARSEAVGAGRSTALSEPDARPLQPQEP